MTTQDRIIETREVRISGGKWATISEYASGTYRWEHPDGRSGNSPSFREAQDALENTKAKGDK